MTNFLINEKSQDSLLLNVLSNIYIHEEIPIMVEKMIQAKKLKVIFCLNPVTLLFQLCLKIAKVPKAVT